MGPVSTTSDTSKLNQTALSPWFFECLTDHKACVVASCNLLAPMNYSFSSVKFLNLSKIKLVNISVIYSFKKWRNANLPYQSENTESSRSLPWRWKHLPPWHWCLFVDDYLNIFPHPNPKQWVQIKESKAVINKWNILCYSSYRQIILSSTFNCHNTSDLTSVVPYQFGNSESSRSLPQRREPLPPWHWCLSRVD